MRSWFKSAFLSCLLTGSSLACDVSDATSHCLLSCGTDLLWDCFDKNNGDDSGEKIFDSPFDTVDVPERSHTPDFANKENKESYLHRTVSGNLNTLIQFEESKVVLLNKEFSQSQEESYTDDFFQEDDTHRQVLSSNPKVRVYFLQQSEMETNFSLQGVANAFFNLERAYGLFDRLPHAFTLQYFLDSSEAYFNLANNFLQSTYTEEENVHIQSNQIYKELNRQAISFAKGETSLEKSPRNIHGDAQRSREKSIQRARENQTRSADFIYTQGLYSEDFEEKKQDLKHALAYSKTRPLSQYFIENKTACFWIYGHFYHGEQGGLPLRDESNAWKNFDKIHLFQGRIMEFFYKTERALMKKVFDSDFGIDDPCVAFWQKLEWDARFIENFFQTWDSAFITYLSHVLIEDMKKHTHSQRMPSFLKNKKITLESAQPSPSQSAESSSSQEDNVSSNESVLSHDALQAKNTTSEKSFAHDYPLTRGPGKTPLSPVPLNFSLATQGQLFPEAFPNKEGDSSLENVQGQLYIQ